MCGVVGDPCPRPRGRGARCARRSSPSSIAARSRPGVAVSDGEQRDGLQGPRHGRPGPRRAPPAVAARPPGHRPLPLLDDRLDPLGERPAGLSPAGPSERWRSATTATWSTRVELLERLPGGRAAHARPRRDTELLTALLADEPGDDIVAALLTVLPPGLAAPTRWSSWTSIASSASATRMASGRWSWAASQASPRPGWSPRRRRPWTSSAPSTCATSSPARWSCSASPAAPRSIRFAEATEHLCVFELIYFARPDSYLMGRNLYEARRRMGEALAREAPVDADTGHARPRHRRRGRGRLRRGERPAVPRGHGQEPLRRPDLHPAIAGDAPARRRHEAQPAARSQSAASRLVVVDDSIVRGTTTRARSWRCFVAPARPRSTCASARRRSTTPASTASTPQIETELIASRLSSRQIREHSSAPIRSAYLSIGGVLDALRAATGTLLLRLLRRAVSGARALRRRLPQVRARGRALVAGAR